MLLIFKKLSRRLDYVRRKMQAPARLRAIRAYIEDICRSEGAEKCKTPDEITAEMLELIRTRHVLPFRDLKKDYFDLLLHRKGRNPADYLFMNEWKHAIAPLNARLDPSLLASVDNKHLHSTLFRKNGFRVPVTMGLLSLQDGRAVVTPEGGETTLLMELLQEHKRLFCKPFEECQGNGCMLLEALPDAASLRCNGKELAYEDFLRENMTASSLLLVEEVVRQHETIAAFHPSSVNTLRLWTLWTKNGPEYFQGAIRMGQGGNHVDNVHQGGVCVGILPDGHLNPIGYVGSEPATEHPDTHEAFAGVRIPFFEEALRMVCAAHRLYPREVFDLGWDIAITPTGPVIIEVNTSASITGLQLTGMEGWREVFLNRLLPEIQAV